MSSTTCLEGVRVVELARVLALPLAGQALGDFGAEVIKIERTGEGDQSRASGAYLPGEPGPDRDSNRAGYMAANRNKKSVTVDFSMKEGQEIVRSLVAKSDIFLENFIPGTLAQYGLDYESLKADNPRLIYCSLTGFGQTGPQSRQPGYDAVFQAQSGIMGITGIPDGEPGAGPMKVGYQVADFMSGLYAAMAVVVALQERTRSGLGQHIDLALLDVAMASMALKAQDYLVTRKVEPRQGNMHLTNAWLSTLLDCADRAIIVTCNTDEHFRRFCGALGAPQLAEDARYRIASERRKNIRELQPALQALVASRDSGEVLSLCKGASVPASPVNDFEQAFAEPHAVQRGVTVELPHPLAADLRVLANPIRFSRTPVTYQLPPPLLGQHTEEVLAGILGMDAERIASLKPRGVV